MVRRYSDLVASMQEIELACQELEGRNSSESLAVITDLREKIRQFYESPGPETAGSIVLFMRNRQSKNQKSGCPQTIFDRAVTVDGLQTNLMSLAQELEDVLRDYSGPIP
ncbi:MAG: hypothetical protein PHS88_08335 [Candidatus Omnitrophica bacterium]|nr:hypothetical protein [Candidatus Omnitrophota bacterium]